MVDVGQDARIIDVDQMRWMGSKYVARAMVTLQV
jgi:hypothetical protein